MGTKNKNKNKRIVRKYFAELDTSSLQKKRREVLGRIVFSQCANEQKAFTEKMRKIRVASEKVFFYVLCFDVKRKYA